MPWYRIDDFNDVFSTCPDRSVTFRNSDLFSFIKEIRLVEYKGEYHKELSVYVIPNLRFADEFNALYSAHFNTVKKAVKDPHNFTDGLIPIKINTQKELENLLAFLKNKRFGIDDPVFIEINQIYSVTQSESKEQKSVVSHVLPRIEVARLTEPSSESDLWNPKYKPTIDNAEFRKKSLKFVAKELSKGRNPNHYYGEELPIIHAVHTDNTPLFNLLLAYFANPFLRSSDYFYESAFEMALRKNNTSMLKAISAVTAKPEKTPSTLKAIDIAIAAGKQLVSTQVSFSNGDKIISLLQPAQNILKEEQTALYNLFADFFELHPSVTSKKLKQEFLNSLTGLNKYIELIYSAKTGDLIGFNCFEIGLPKGHQDHVVLHCMYSLIKPAYRGHGIMALLAFRLAFSLQKLLPSAKIAIFFCAVHYNSYRLAERLLHFPKYRSEHMDPLISDILKTFFKDDFSLQEEKDGIKCFLDEEVRVKGKTQIKSDNLLEEFFYQWLLDLKEGSTDIRSAPVLFYASQHTFAQLARTLQKININFSDHLDELAYIIKTFFSDVISFPRAKTEAKHDTETKTEIKITLPTHSVFWQRDIVRESTATTRLNKVLGHLRAA